MIRKLAEKIHNSWYYINVIIFIIRVLKLFLMKYRSVLLILIVIAFLLAPASADLRKIGAKSPVYIGETEIDISSPLNGCHQIAWWPAGNTTDTPPGKILDIEGDMYKYNISPDVFSGYTGTWYRWDLKPVAPVFDVLEPEFDLKVWDLDHDRDVTGQTVPRSTRITYRIDTNLYQILDTKYKRPELTPLDSFMEVTLTGPTGQALTNIYTGSAGLPDTEILKLDTNPIVTSTPYYWKDGGRWNHTARDRDGTVLYPPGTYTFYGTQNLNNMRFYYGNDSRVATGARTITFAADAVVTTPPVTSLTGTITASPTVTAVTTPATVPVQTATGTPKPTWTSTPLPPEIILMALVLVGITGLYRLKKS